MAKMPLSDSLMQISLNANCILKADQIQDKDYADELREFRQGLLKSSKCDQWPHKLDLVASPHPVLVPKQFTLFLDKLGDILGRAITSIVERWWSDPRANFPDQMPLPPLQEEILRWIEGPGSRIVPAFSIRRGFWRPDYLLSSTNATRNTENDRHSAFGLANIDAVQICEINSRFAFNSYFGTAFAHQAFHEKGLEALNLESPLDPEKVFAAYWSLVDFDKPLHLLKGSEAGYDIHLFKSYFQERFGLKTRFIKPSDLRLVPNKDVEHGSILYCTPEHPHFDVSRELPSEGLEQVHQVFLELHQHELQNLGSEILKALAPICFNDLRTIFLVHDKRMLGVVLHELDSLVIEHEVVKNDEALILRRSIVPTFIPGSQEFEREFANILDSKEEYILKPSGSGKGDGIVFGADLTPDLWLHSLENLKDARGEVPKCVVQRVVTQPKYNVIIPKNNSRSAVFQNPYVGTFMMANGKTLGIGCWRTSQNKICAVSEGGTWMWSLTSSTTNGINLASEITTSNLPRLRVSRFEDVSESNKVQAINEALQKHGLLILTLPFPDPQSQYLLCVIHCLRLQHKHGPPLTHSSTRGWFWDVRPNPSSVTEQKYTARSETTEEFPWHTDCSYASHPPKFFGLHVLQADRYGGGTLSVLLVESFVKNLSEETIEALSASEFRIDVPPEFADGTEFIVGPLLSRSSSSGNDEARIRFRADIIKPLTPRAETALEELNKELRRVREKGLCLDLKAEDLPNGSVVLIDNGRWLHARNKVKDEGRWLRRIRWDAREF